MFYEEEKHALQVFGDFRDTQDVFGWETLNVGRTFLSLIRVSRGKKGSGALMETQESRHLNLQLLVSLQALRRWLGSLRPTQLFLFWFTLVVLVLMLSDAEGQMAWYTIQMNPNDSVSLSVCISLKVGMSVCTQLVFHLFSPPVARKKNISNYGSKKNMICRNTARIRKRQLQTHGGIISTAALC